MTTRRTRWEVLVILTINKIHWRRSHVGFDSWPAIQPSTPQPASALWGHAGRAIIGAHFARVTRPEHIRPPYRVIIHPCLSCSGLSSQFTNWVFSSKTQVCSQHWEWRVEVLVVIHHLYFWRTEARLILEVKEGTQPFCKRRFSVSLVFHKASASHADPRGAATQSPWGIYTPEIGAEHLDADLIWLPNWSLWRTAVSKD